MEKEKRSKMNITERIIMTKPTLPSLGFPRPHKVVSDDMIDYHFKGTDFGQYNTTAHRRMLLANAALKTQAGWWNGQTIYLILVDCDLVSDKGNITKRGRLFIYEELSTDNV